MQLTLKTVFFLICSCVIISFPCEGMRRQFTPENNKDDRGRRLSLPKLIDTEKQKEKQQNIHKYVPREILKTWTEREAFEVDCIITQAEQDVVPRAVSSLTGKIKADTFIRFLGLLSDPLIKEKSIFLSAPFTPFNESELYFLFTLFDEVPQQNINLLIGETKRNIQERNEKDIHQDNPKAFILRQMLFSPLIEEVSQKVRLARHIFVPLEFLLPILRCVWKNKTLSHTDLSNEAIGYAGRIFQGYMDKLKDERGGDILGFLQDPQNCRKTAQLFSIFCQPRRTAFSSQPYPFFEYSLDYVPSKYLFDFITILGKKDEHVWEQFQEERRERIKEQEEGKEQKDAQKKCKKDKKKKLKSRDKLKENSDETKKSDNIFLIHDLSKKDVKNLFKWMKRYAPILCETSDASLRSWNDAKKVEKSVSLFELLCQTPKKKMMEAVSELSSIIPQWVEVEGKYYMIKAALSLPPDSRPKVLESVYAFAKEDKNGKNLSLITKAFCNVPIEHYDEFIKNIRLLLGSLKIYDDETPQNTPMYGKAVYAATRIPLSQYQTFSTFFHTLNGVEKASPSDRVLLFLVLARKPLGRYLETVSFFNQVTSRKDQREWQKTVEALADIKVADEEWRAFKEFLTRLNSEDDILILNNKTFILRAFAKAEAHERQNFADQFFSRLKILKKILMTMDSWDQGEVIEATLVLSNGAWEQLGKLLEKIRECDKANKEELEPVNMCLLIKKFCEASQEKREKILCDPLLEARKIGF